MKDILKVDALSKRFGGIAAVDGCSFEVERGSITALIGPNGSGKTTTFNLITGIYRPDSGNVFFGERCITNTRGSRLCNIGLSRTFQITRLFYEMSVLDNMIVPVRHVGFRSLFGPGMRRDEEHKALDLLERVGLLHLKDEPASELSFGQQKLLELAGVLMSDPELMLLDEPAGGVNPTMIGFIMDLITDLNREEGVTFLVVEHNMDMVMELCHPVIVMDQGEKIAEGSPEEVRANPDVLEAYLGV